MSNYLKSVRYNITLPGKTDKRLDEVCLKLFHKEGRVIPALKPKLMRAAIEEWLDAHEDDADDIQL